MLPGVDSQKRLQVAGDGVLVGASDEAEVSGRLVLDEPGPAGALDAGEGGVGLLLEVVEGGKVLLDGGLYIPLVNSSSSIVYCAPTYQKLALGLTTAALAVGGEVLPEEGVVDVATAVEVEQRCLGSGGLGVALGLGIAEGLDGGVEAVDVCLVVLGVVELHDLAGDGGLERAVVVWSLGRFSWLALFYSVLFSERYGIDCL